MKHFMDPVVWLGISENCIYNNCVWQGTCLCGISKRLTGPENGTENGMEYGMENGMENGTENGMETLTAFLESHW